MLVRTTVHSAELRQNPCFVYGPFAANCGQQMGTPPRTALPLPYSALDDTNRFSRPPVIHEVRCAP